jgi:hypothetical protein
MSIMAYLYLSWREFLKILSVDIVKGSIVDYAYMAMTVHLLQGGIEIFINHTNGFEFVKTNG